MSIKFTDIILGIALGLIAIYLTHDFIVADACLDMGGGIAPNSGFCIDENYHEQYMVVTPVLLVIYFFIGLVISVVSALVIKAVRRAKGE